MSRSLTRSLALAALMSTTVSGVAFAGAPIITFEWSPSAAGLSANAPDIVTNGLVTGDFATINVSPTGAFSETAYLPLGSIASGGGLVTPNGLNGSGSASPYQLYFKATATGQLSGVPTSPSAMVSGTFSTVSFALDGLTGDGANFDNFDANNQIIPTGISGAITLGGGSLINDVNNSVSTTGTGAADATADVSFVGINPLFFVSPPAGTLEFAFTSFQNNSGVVNFFPATPAEQTLGFAETLTIANSGAGGAGTVEFELLPVPEPATFGLFGVGLAVLGLVYRRKRS
jgi:hypothetical protein